MRLRSRAGSTSPSGAGTRRAHRLDDPLRVDPAGKPYPAVPRRPDGGGWQGCARALAELARARWACATSEHVHPIGPDGDPWPDDVPPDFTQRQGRYRAHAARLRGAAARCARSRRCFST